MGLAGCAIFSFMEVGLRGEQGYMQLGKPFSWIHQMVPGFNAPEVGIGAKVLLFFKNLKVGEPYFRTNWILVPEKGLDPRRYTLSDHRGDGPPVSEVAGMAPDELHLRVE